MDISPRKRKKETADRKRTPYYIGESNRAVARIQKTGAGDGASICTRPERTHVGTIQLHIDKIGFWALVSSFLNHFPFFFLPSLEQKLKRSHLSSSQPFSKHPGCLSFATNPFSKFAPAPGGFIVLRAQSSGGKRGLGYV